MVFIGTGQFGGDHHGVRHSDHSKVAGTGFQSSGSMNHVRRSFQKEIAEREVTAWRVIAWRSFCAIRHPLFDNKVALKHRLRFPLIMRCVIHVLVFRQLDSDTVTVHSLAGNTRQDA